MYSAHASKHSNKTCQFICLNFYLQSAPLLTGLPKDEKENRRLLNFFLPDQLLLLYILNILDEVIRTSSDIQTKPF